VIRPSSRGAHNLTITWKAYEDVYRHVNVVEKDKPETSELDLGRRLLIGSDEFEDLDHIVARFVDPIVRFNNGMYEAKAFKFGDEEEVRTATLCNLSFMLWLPFHSYLSCILLIIALNLMSAKQQTTTGGFIRFQRVLTHSLSDSLTHSLTHSLTL
jgi:hypothetical protein